MSKERIVGTVASIVDWLSQSDATSLQEDLDLTSALQTLRNLPEEAFADFHEESERLPAEETSEPAARMSDAAFLEAAKFLERNDARLLDCTLETPNGEPLIAMEAEGFLVFVLVLYTPPGRKQHDVDLAARKASRQQMDEIVFGFIAENGSWKHGPVRFDILRAVAVEGSLVFSLWKGAWDSNSAPGFVDSCTRERFAELVSEYRGTGDCFEGCEIADKIADLLDSELL